MLDSLLHCITIETSSVAGGCAPRPMHLGSTIIEKPLPKFLDPPLYNASVYVSGQVLNQVLYTIYVRI